MTESEIWKDVAEYEGVYQVSDKGNVRSLARVDSLGRECRGRVLKQGYSSGGYPQVNLYKNGKRKSRLIHRLVVGAFIPNPESLPQVNHIDEDKDNNNLENLEWCDSKYNVNYGTRTERVSKKVRAVNVETGEVITFNSTQEAGRKGYSSGGVSTACLGTYTASTGKLVGGDGHLYKGYRWEYYEVAEGNEGE